MLDILQNDLALNFIWFLEQSLDYVVSKLVGQQIVKVDIWRLIDVLNNELVVSCNQLDVRLHWNVDDLVQNLILKLL